MIRWPWGKPRPGCAGCPAPSDPPTPEPLPDSTARRDAFERLARAHAVELYGAALRLARNPDDAQDLAQDTLVRAYAAFDAFAPGSNFRAWLLRILTNCYITLYRRRQRVAFVAWDELTDTNDAGRHRREAVVSTRGAAMDEPETALLARALDSEIAAALSKLSEGVRLAVLLVDVEELSYEEAAAVLEIPVGTVRSRLNRGREQMRGYLKEYARERRLV